MNLKPHQGVDDIKFGSSMGIVARSLGAPGNKNRREFKDESCDEVWEYPRLGLSLTFSSDDDWLLGTITVESEEADLEGCRLIGLEEQVFLLTARQAGIAPIELDDDFEELGSRDYVCRKLDISFWVSEGILTSITLFPKYDESGEIPIWPK